MFAAVTLLLVVTTRVNPEESHAEQPAVPIASNKLTQLVVAVAPHESTDSLNASIFLAAWIPRIAMGDYAAAPLRIVSPIAAHGLAQVAVGRVAVAALGVPAADLSSTVLGMEGFLLSSNRTAAIRADGSVALSGAANSSVGTMYAAQQFLRVLGLRYLAWDETLLPATAPTTVPAVDMQFAPRFHYRQIYDWGSQINETQSRYFHGNTGNYANPPGNVHNSYKLFPGERPNCTSGNGCPPTNLWRAHPEWWWPRDDPKAYGQLCWSNVSMVKYIIQRATEMLAAQPSARIISISQNDNDNYCRSPAELAIIREEGSPMGPLLRAVNTIAKALAPAFPDVAVDTLAYAYTQTPPRLTKPEANVIIRLCVSDVNAAVPLSDPSNANFSSTLKGWFNLTQRIYIWNYVGDFGNYLQSFPDYYSLGCGKRLFCANFTTTSTKNDHFTKTGSGQA